MTEQQSNQGIFQFDEFVLDLARGALQKHGEDIPLRPKSFEVLHYLVEHSGQLAAKDVLTDAVWGHQFVSDDSLAQCIIDIRRALDDHQQELVKTVPRRGYLLDVPVKRLDSGDAHDGPGNDSTAQHQQAPNTPAPPPRISSATAIVVLILLVIFVAFLLWRGEENVVVPEQGAPGPSVPKTSIEANSIAVLPFVDLSPDGDQAYLADGLSEEILNLLAQSSSMRVIARTSSFSFRDSDEDIPSIASKLGVSHVLEGSVRKDGQDLRITVQLISADSAVHLWSRSYDRKLEKILDLQYEIAAAITESLETTLAEKSPHKKVVPQAYEAFLQADFFYNRRAPGDLEQALNYYRKAVELDDRFAPAWVGVSATLNVLQVDGTVPRDEVIDEQFHAAQTALSLDPGLAIAHVRMAQAYGSLGINENRDFHWLEAQRLEPNNPLVLAVMAGYKVWNNQLDLAIALQKRAVAADPISASERGNLAFYLFFAGKYREALEELEQTNQLNPAKARDHLWTILQIHIVLQHFEHALERSIELEEPAKKDFIQAVSLTGLNRPDEAQQALNRLQSRQGLLPLTLMIHWYAWSGDREAVLDLLPKTLTTYKEVASDRPELEAQQWKFLFDLAMSPMLGDFHSDQEFVEWKEAAWNF